ncbi:ead/Ea22-like family protein [Yersinia mollaretii]|nr:ead/Ea22-like family protein [Yersinia mollaretii]CNI38098.1 Uncharacterised protein [Yersinia mollaretii]
MNNLEELKKSAMKATQGKWVAFSNIKTGTFAVHTPDDKRCNDIVDWMGFDGAAGSKTQRSHNAKFIAAANPSVVLALIAQLEAAQKELFDLHNQELQQRLANAEHQLYMKDLAIHNIKASRKAQFRKRLAAEAALSAANEKLKVVALLEELPTPDMRGDEPFKEALDYVSGWNACVSKIKAAGFTVEGDTNPIVIVPAPPGVVMRPQFEKPLERCAAARDGECSHKDCPQLRDNEPMATGRHCPIDDWDDE